MVNLNLNSIEATLRKNSKTLGMAYGYLAPMVKLAQSRGQDPIETIIKQHEEAINALMAGKLPKIENILIGLRSEDIAGPILKNALIAYLAGELGGGFIGASNAAALKRFATEAAKLAVVSSAVVVTGWNPHPPSDIQTSRSSMSHSNTSGYSY